MITQARASHIHTYIARMFDYVTEHEVLAKIGPFRRKPQPKVDILLPHLPLRSTSNNRIGYFLSKIPAFSSKFVGARRTQYRLHWRHDWLVALKILKDESWFWTGKQCFLKTTDEMWQETSGLATFLPPHGVVHDGLERAMNERIFF